jgi:hypothetical protein
MEELPADSTEPKAEPETKKSFIGGTPGGKVYKRVEIPTPEQITGEDFMNNCMTRSVMSTVLGGGMGVVFGLFMGGMRESMDPVRRYLSLHPHDKQYNRSGRDNSGCMCLLSMVRA